MRYLTLPIIVAISLVGCGQKAQSWESELFSLENANKITLVYSSILLDGGTTTLYAIADSGQRCSVRLNQHVIETSADPARLFFNDELVEVRSEEERRILDLLKEADIHPLTPESVRQILASPAGSKVELEMFAVDASDTIIAQLRDSVVTFVESDEYASVALNDLPET
ncbi:hypothetical protein [Aporhodopirellula aestuarii]|uniref:Uncharacterized protein n=1 Tax=Aporhodopirellula aestuarii TaxID=2950107 RepID=A0ABT0U5K2_9BACT|nr:hypothetical protein [Aporhodopirellula aestuarii]MCM2372194.1 hypothetical protein [Aporhodopirellula aestuarii]